MILRSINAAMGWAHYEIIEDAGPASASATYILIV